MTQTRSTQSAAPNENDSSPGGTGGLVPEFHGVRYQVKDVSRSVAFYTRQLGFKLGHQQLPAFANVSLGNLTILLSGPGGKEREGLFPRLGLGARVLNPILAHKVVELQSRSQKRLRKVLARRREGAGINLRLRLLQSFHPLPQ